MLSDGLLGKRAAVQDKKHEKYTIDIGWKVSDCFLEIVTELQMAHFADRNRPEPSTYRERTSKKPYRTAFVLST